MADAETSSTGGRAVLPEQAQVPVITTIDDAVSLIRSVEATLDESAPSPALVPVQVREVLLPALRKQYHAQKGKGQRIFVQALQGGIDPLDMLDTSRNTLGYAYILACRISQATAVDVAQTLVAHVDIFSRSFNPAQLIGAGEIVTILARGIAQIGQTLGDPIGSLTSLLRLFDGFRSVQGGFYNLTTLHPIVVYQCLRAQHYHAAIDWVLKYDVVQADENITLLAYTDVLEYLYYGGMAFARALVFDKACEFFELCVSSPAQQVSVIQVDAYKKLILLQLLKDGKTVPLPPYTSQAFTRAVRGKVASIDAYQKLARAYEAEPPVLLFANDRQELRRRASAVEEALQSEASKMLDTLTRDANVGLVKQLLASYTKRRIFRASRLFDRLKVGDLVVLLGRVATTSSPEDEATTAIVNALREMDADHWLRLTVEGDSSKIQAADLIVHFDAVHTDHSGLEAAQRLTKVMQEAKFWDQAVEAKRKAVRSSETYLAKQLNPTTRGAFGGINVEDYEDDAFS